MCSRSPRGPMLRKRPRRLGPEPHVNLVAHINQKPHINRDGKRDGAFS
jgi:hypothetical protein